MDELEQAIERAKRWTSDGVRSGHLRQLIEQELREARIELGNARTLLTERKQEERCIEALHTVIRHCERAQMLVAVLPAGEASDVAP